MEELRNVHYDAFISYRHSELDAFVAERIHKKLEAFKLPKSARAKVKNGKTRIERIFRDEEELPLSDNLMDPITNALNNSDYLITICSPRYLESKWCMKEIEVFLETHDREHILVVLADGDPEASFPKILTFDEIESIDENGNKVITRREIEPLAADTRGENRRDVTKAIDSAIVKLCAEIFEINYDDLRRRQRKQKFRRNLMVFGSIGAALLVFAIFALIMFLQISRQKETISEQYAELQDRYASSMETVSEKLMGDGRRKDAAYALRSVLPDNETDGYNADALRGLYSVMNVYGLERKHAPRNIFEMESEIESYGVSFDGKYIWVGSEQFVKVFDAVSGKVLKEIERRQAPDTGFFDAAFCGSEGLLVLEGDGVYYYSLNGNEIKKIDVIRSDPFLAESEDGTVTFACSDEIVFAIDNKGNVLYEIDLCDIFEDGDYFEYCYADFDNERALLCFRSFDSCYLIVIDERTGEIIDSLYEENVTKAAGVLDGDKLYYAVMDDMGVAGNTPVFISAYDCGTSNYLWKVAFRDVFFENMFLSEYYVYLADEGMILALERMNGGVKNFYYLETNLISSWCDEGELFFINFDGAIHGCDENRLYDSTEYFYVNAPASKIVSAVRKNGRLFCRPNQGSYIICYDVDDNDGSQIEYDQDGSYRNSNPADEALKEALGDVYSMVRDSVFSDDKKYIAALLSDHTIKIYDAVSMEEITWFEKEMSYFTSMRYYELSKCYVLSGRYESVFLNDRFEIICVSKRIMEEKDGRFIMRDSSGLCYLVPFVGYEDLIKLTDAYLDGYEPSDAVKRKYNID